MTVSRIRAEVERLLVELLRADLAIDTQAVIVSAVGGLKTITWGGSRGSAVMPDTPSATIAEYRRILSDGHYSCVLRDGSVLQISISLDRDQVVKHRMVYFPCPLVFDPSDLDVVGELTFSDLFELALGEEFAADSDSQELDAARDDGRLRLRSPLRFDYDIDAMRDGHPGSHVHLSDETVRWPIFGPLSVGHFVRFVFRHFYPEAWAEHEFLRSWPVQFGPRCVTASEEAEMFIDCHARELNLVVA